MYFSMFCIIFEVNLKFVGSAIIDREAIKITASLNYLMKE
jgi:hypothetical protein